MNSTTPSPKWRQFLEEAQLQWPLLDLQNRCVENPNELAALLSQIGGICQCRSEREVREMIDHFELRIRRAA